MKKLVRWCFFNMNSHTQNLWGSQLSCDKIATSGPMPILCSKKKYRAISENMGMICMALKIFI